MDTAESEEWEPVEKHLEEMVSKRRTKVERLERELDAFRKHYARLLESFSFPTFPEGTLPSRLTSFVVLVLSRIAFQWLAHISAFRVIWESN
jgi:hypothetical protein